MKRIRSQQEIDKKNRRNQVIIGLTLVVLMMFSTVGYTMMDRGTESTKRVDYHGVKFVGVNGVWQIEDTQVYFNYLPTELEDVSVEGNFDIANYSGKTLYFVNYAVAGDLIINNLQGQIERYQEACLSSDCDANLPMKNCEEDNIIIFSSEEGSRVYKEGNCVYITQDYAKGVDAFIYRLFGIN